MRDGAVVTVTRSTLTDEDYLRLDCEEDARMEQRRTLDDDGCARCGYRPEEGMEQFLQIYQEDARCPQCGDRLPHIQRNGKIEEARDPQGRRFRRRT